MTSDGRGANTESSGRSAARGCLLAAAALSMLCVVPVGAAAVFELFGVAGGRGHGAPITPLVDPSHAGLGIGGPHMPAGILDVHPVPMPDSKVLDLRVVSIEGATWTEVGATCRVRAQFDPMALSTPCSAHVTCGEMPVYGDGEAVGLYDCSPRPVADGLRPGADRAPMSEDGSPLFAVEEEVVRVSSSEGGRARAFELVLSRSLPPEAPVIDPATVVDPAVVQAVPPTWPDPPAP